MKPTPELTDMLFEDEVRRARATPPEQKIFAGADLFEYVCEIMRDGIRWQYPDADEQQVRRLLGQRLELIRRLEKAL